MLPENTPSLSDILLTTAAEHTWPGKVPQGSLPDVARSLKNHIESFPCLQGHTIVETLLNRLNTVKTNGDFLLVTEEIFKIVGMIRKSLEKSGVLRHTTQPHELMVATISLPNTLPGAMPLDNVKRLQENSAFLMVLHYTNRVLSVLAQASLTLQNRISESSEPKALVDAQPITIPGEQTKEKRTAIENHSGHETKPEEFIWCGVNFDKRMKLVPYLATSYMSGEPSISFASIREKYQEIMMGKELKDANMYALLRNIRVKFEAENKKVPFQIQQGFTGVKNWNRGGGIQFIYDSSLEINPVQDEGGTGTISTEDIPEDAFLSEVFDPRILTGSQPLKIKELTDEAIDDLKLDEMGKRILKTLFAQTKVLHISALAEQCQTTIQEINAYVATILQALWMQGYTVRIAIENDSIQLIK